MTSRLLTTDEHIDIAYKYRAGQETKKIAKEYGTTTNNIHQIAHRLEIRRYKKPAKKWYPTKQELKTMKELGKSMSVADIAKHLRKTYCQVRRAMEKHNIPTVYSHKERSKR